MSVSCILYKCVIFRICPSSWRPAPCKKSSDPEPCDGCWCIINVDWQLPLTEVVEPVDFEEYVSSHAPGVEPGPLRQLVEFPQDDLELLPLDKECTTLEPPLPEEEEWVRLPTRPSRCTPRPSVVFTLQHTHTHTEDYYDCNGGQTSLQMGTKPFSLDAMRNQRKY